MSPDRRNIENESQVRHSAVNRNTLNRAHELRIKITADALINTAGIDKAIAQHNLSGFNCRTDFLINMIAAALAGIMIPLLLDRFGADPAVSSAVFVTTVTDVTGFFAFLGLATWWFRVS